MDHQDIRTLKILEELDSEQVPSQRDLARELNVSLGLVNSFVKRLVKKGYFKVTNIPANRVKYILTPKGAAEKTRLTYQYIQHSFEFYKTARRKVRGIMNDLEAQEVQRVVFGGVSDLAEIAYVSLQETSIQLVAVVDDSKKGERFLGATIRGWGDLDILSFDRVLVTSLDAGDDLVGEILAAGISRKLIVKIN